MMSAMTEAGTISVTARAQFGTREQLAALKPLFQGEKKRAKALAREEPWRTAGLPGRETAAVRARWQEHRAQLRERGELVDTLDVWLWPGRASSCWRTVA
jgi:hypothetical protein